MPLVFRALLTVLLTALFSGLAAGAASKYRWRKGPISVSISTSVTSNISNIDPGSDVSGAIDRSLAAWQAAASVTFRRVSSNEMSASPAGGQGDGVSLVTIAATPENVALFPLGLDDATALTVVFYDSRGFITEADIVLNPFLQFSTDGTPGTFDLESTLTHEVGHLLGLNHSPVISATMSDDYGRNGVYGLPAFFARTLASDDIAAVRSLYGAPAKSEECCGRLSGRLTLTNGKPVSNYTVWAENAETGRVIAAASTQPDGSFRLGGIPFGKSVLYAQGNSSSPTFVSELGEFNINGRPIANVSRKLDIAPADSETEYLGFNGQLSGMAVTVNSGSAYFLMIGSRSNSVADRIGSASGFILVDPETSLGDFGSGIRTIGFEAAVSAETPPGEYSLVIRNPAGERRFLIGGLTVEKYPNFWTTAFTR